MRDPQIFKSEDTEKEILSFFVKRQVKEVPSENVSHTFRASRSEVQVCRRSQWKAPVPTVVMIIIQLLGPASMLERFQSNSVQLYLKRIEITVSKYFTE